MYLHINTWLNRSKLLSLLKIIASFLSPGLKYYHVWVKKKKKLLNALFLPIKLEFKSLKKSFCCKNYLDKIDFITFSFNFLYEKLIHDISAWCLHKLKLMFRVSWLLRAGNVEADLHFAGTRH